MKRFQM